jgi:outer membrane protein assembly factor BamB
MHALDMDTGEVAWQNGFGTDALRDDASYSPSSAVPGLVFTGGVVAPQLRAWNADTGELAYDAIVSSPFLANAITSAAAVVDGTVIVGTGIGTRTGDPHDVEDQVSREPREVVALWVPEPGATAAGLAALAGLAVASARSRRARHR